MLKVRLGRTVLRAEALHGLFRAAGFISGGRKYPLLLAGANKTGPAAG